MNFISRKDAAQKLRSHWLATRSKEELLAMHEPDWPRLRNYEIEARLEKEFGPARTEIDGVIDGLPPWVINEYCPFDGRFCSWGTCEEQHSTSTTGGS